MLPGKSVVGFLVLLLALCAGQPASSAPVYNVETGLSADLFRVCPVADTRDPEDCGLPIDEYPELQVATDEAFNSAREQSNTIGNASIDLSIATTVVDAPGQAFFGPRLELLGWAIGSASPPGFSAAESFTEAQGSLLFTNTGAETRTVAFQTFLFEFVELSGDDEPGASVSTEISILLTIDGAATEARSSDRFTENIFLELGRTR